MPSWLRSDAVRGEAVQVESVTQLSSGPRAVVLKTGRYGVQLISAILISDIHFRKHANDRFDADLELRNGMLRHIPSLVDEFGDISLILVCGDVAYNASDDQYATAKTFLTEVQAKLGGARVLVIPGNHDIDRKSTKSPDQRKWRATPRGKGMRAQKRVTELSKLLQDERSGGGLLEPLAGYNRFAAAYGCEISSGDPCWTKRVSIDTAYKAQVRGMTSVLISDENDNKSKERLVLGDMQVTDLAQEAGVVQLTLCHHPYTWLFDGDLQRDRLRHRSELHITGHDHAHEVKVDDETGKIHVCAGALQPTRNLTWKPRMYALSLEVSETQKAAKLKIHLAGSIWDPKNDVFVRDVDERFEIPIERGTKGSGSQGAPDADEAVIRLVERFSALQPADRTTVATEIGVDFEEISSTPAYELPMIAIRHAEKEGTLSRLWERVELHHGNQATDANPFDGGKS